MDLANLPKVELHSHLDCCLSYDAARRIDPRITRGHYARTFVAPPKCASLADYLTYTLHYRALLQSGRALRIAVQDVFEQMSRDGIAYAELRFAPLVHTEGGELSADQVVAHVAEETAAQSAATGIDAGLILCTLRDYDAGRSLETARLAVRHARSGPVVALDIAGDEIAHPLDPHVPAFAHARDGGLGVTVHAGESGGPGSVREALDKTGTRRIGHGVRSAEDPELLARLREEGVHLEVCPSCNVQTSTAPSLAEHPVGRLREAGVRVGISTDTRAVTGVRLTEEYERLRDVHGWTLADFAEVNRAALAASFAPEPVRARVATFVDEAYAGAAS
ncbi:adenosine deaminase [Spirillospora sp. NBC_01491]|uniref:adenosine deaminase n=1 Tax=Spirillospora sp. NBC_01491 TaxID=2976007 RepID=UPI002E2FA085|nr:adenosine deaminase [Spirillospora sp. NBC_01491]